jgi:hypothetical protein
MDLWYVVDAIEWGYCVSRSWSLELNQIKGGLATNSVSFEDSKMRRKTKEQELKVFGLRDSKAKIYTIRINGITTDEMSIDCIYVLKGNSGKSALTAFDVLSGGLHRPQPY